nr:uncharacterized mitochondrial protein AtMg00810-like [Tanacetum cinerariifolium]
MLKKSSVEDSKQMKIPMSSDAKLTKDKECGSVDSTKYQGMIGRFLYLTASRPDIMFSVCLCARFQEDPKASHLEAVKRIFRYIKGTTHLGLWYPKGIGIETVVYADSDHAGDYMAQKSTSGQNNSGKCLLSWGNRDHVPACLCHMLYCIAKSEQYNLAFFIAKLMEFVTKQPRLILPYGMLLTQLFKYVMSESPKLSSDRYVLCDRIMYPLTAQEERKTQKDYGTRRGRSFTSSSSAFGQPSSYHPNDDNNGGNDEGTSHASTPSLTRFVNSLSNDIPQIFSNPPDIDPNMEAFYTCQTEILNRQVQLRDEQHGRIWSIRKGIKNLLRGKKKKPLNPLSLQSHPSLDITLSLSPITPLDHILDTPSPPSPQPPPQPPLMGHPIYFNMLDYHGVNYLCCFYNRNLILSIRDELNLMFAHLEYLLTFAIASSSPPQP